MITANVLTPPRCVEVRAREKPFGPGTVSPGAPDTAGPVDDPARACRRRQGNVTWSGPAGGRPGATVAPVRRRLDVAELRMIPMSATMPSSCDAVHAEEKPITRRASH